METKKRSVAKAVTWRVVAVLTLGILGYIITGDFEKVGPLTLVFTIVQFIMYFVHERIWGKIRWGKVEHPLSRIEVSKKISPDDIEKIENKLREMGYM